MARVTGLDVTALAGLHWHENGQASLSGNLLTLEQRLERMFLAWAARSSAVEHRFPTFIAARELDKLDYFRSFAHLVTFPVALDPEHANLERFVAGQPLNGAGEVQLTQTAPVRDVLTPAACYHFYALFQGRPIEAPRYLTTRATCFRREEYYRPLERQWSFGMREIVCIGTSAEVQAFLARYEKIVVDFFRRIDLPVQLCVATDPFFNPSKNPKYVMQMIDPVKREMVFDGRLAIGSINFHRSFFGETFDMRRDGQPAFSGCVAFGIERWIYAIVSRFGADPVRWPALESET